MELTITSVLYCGVCRKLSSSYCGNCNFTAYCSVACQKQDWPRHKSICSRKTRTVSRTLLINMHDDVLPYADLFVLINNIAMKECNNKLNRKSGFNMFSVFLIEKGYPLQLNAKETERVYCIYTDKQEDKASSWDKDEISLMMRSVEGSFPMYIVKPSDSYTGIYNRVKIIYKNEEFDLKQLKRLLHDCHFFDSNLKQHERLLIFRPFVGIINIL